eukprot:CAMPEP_0201568994 /NCGR_PEP_ID=MMETSP0190_2-20130828/10417_1 /ASSEMBLY_ACC=CAM_ASM_000263 /TAXON_ID=37353 /ORGANISM="Rosalina sp." /LENGTH=108 /DNA_ID=CAMNT_0047990815 /DNA_START=735 /DNA_END=1061 /DNA_ORIENTATION=+
MRGEENAIGDWYLNTENVPGIMDASKNQWIVEIWGSVNILLVVIHWILWIKELIRRHGVALEDVDQVLYIDWDGDGSITVNDEKDNLDRAVQMGDNNKTESEPLMDDL